jgi:3-(methylthio)propionyl---CoA ligase
MHGYELLLDKFVDHAAKWHDRAEVVTGGGTAASERITYRALRDQANALSGALAALGLGHGDRIATLAWNSHAHMEFWFAAVGIGISCHTLNPRLGAAQLADIVRQAGARLLVASPDQAATAAQLQAECPSIAHVVILDEPGAPAPAGGRRHVELRETLGAPVPWGGFSEHSESGLCFTSGTTGAPKGVPYTHRAIYLMTQTLLQADVMGIGCADSVLVAVPMFHANAWGLPYAVPAVGARLVLPGRHTDGASLAALIADEQVTVAVGVPTVWLGLVDHLDSTGGSLPSLRRVVLGGSSIPQALMDRIAQRLGVEVKTSWGMTELSPLGTVSPGAGPARRSGRPPVGVDLRLTDADGVPLAEQRGAEGHLQVRGASVITHYLGQAEPAGDAQGWFDTGDLALIEPDGDLVITGRSKDLIKSGGEWINPGEMEAILGALPAVGLVAVVGRAHPKWTERPIVVIEPRAGANVSDAEVMGSLEAKVPRWWLPDAILRVDRMPLAATGKIDKQQLRRELG